MNRLLLAILALLCAADTSQAADASLARITPRGATRGGETEITLIGTRLHDAQEILFYEPGITVKNLAAADERTVKATIAVAPDARVGEHYLRVRTATGISQMRTFFVGALPAVEEKEPNNEFAGPQKLDLNVTVNGVMQNEDVDHYLIEAKKGQRISLEVEGLRASPTILDPFVAILDENQKEIVSADDSSLLAQDPVLSIVAPHDGRYVVQIRDSSYGGTNEATYRLHVGTFPRPTAVYPAGGQAGQDVKVQFLGDALGPFSQSIKLPGEPRARFAVLAEQNGQVAPSANVFRVSPFPNMLESEPNDSMETATLAGAELPLAFNGIIEKPGDRDIFKFRAKKGERLHVNVYARRVRTALDPVLSIERGSRTVASNDDINPGNPDCYVRFDPPEDDEYAVVIADHLKQGGADYVYRVEVTKTEQRLSVSLPFFDQNNGQQERQVIVVPKGNRFATPMRLFRTEFGGEVALSPQDFPEGIALHAPAVAEGIDTVPVVFEAAQNAPTGGKLAGVNAKPTKDGDDKIAGPFAQSVNLVPEGNNRPYYETDVDKLAIAVAEEAPFKINLVQPKVPIVQGGSMALKVIAERKADFTGPIRLQMVFSPPGISAGLAEIDEGQSEGVVPLNAEDGAASGRKWSIAVLGSADLPDGRVWCSTQLGELEVAPAMLAMSMEMMTVRRGETGQLVVDVQHKTPFEGKAKVKLVGLPPNVEAKPEEVEITSSDKTATFNVVTNDKSPIGQHKSLLCVVTVTKDGEPIVHNVARGGVLRIDAPPEGAQAQKKPDANAKDAQAARPVNRLEQLRQEAAARKGN